MHSGAGHETHREFVIGLIAAASRRRARRTPRAIESNFFKMANDTRVTRVGRFLRKSSLDELPQLWNVLRGDMSLVGPRPPIPYEVEHYPPHWFDRFAVKPGMTGLWQVSGRSELGLEEMIALDVEYARTPLAVAQREDPCADRAGRLRRPWCRLMRAGRVLIISENAPVPADRRVWNISRTLAAAGWQVVIACAQGADRDDAPYEVLEGIEIHRYPLRPAASTLGYAREYGQALWRLRKLVRRLSRERRFDVVHACNPPDLLLLAARSPAPPGHALHLRPPRPGARALPLALRARRGPLLPRDAARRARRLSDGRRRRWPPTGPTRASPSSAAAWIPRTSSSCATGPT